MDNVFLIETLNANPVTLLGWTPKNVRRILGVFHETFTGRDIYYFEDGA